MVLCNALITARNKRKYLRFRLRYPSHLARTGHRWKEGVDEHGNKTGFCAVCGKKRVVKNLIYQKAGVA